MNKTLVSEYMNFYNESYAHKNIDYPHLTESEYQSIVLARANLTWTRAIEVATNFSAHINETHSLSTSACFNAYSKQYTSSWADVMLVHTSTVDLAKVYGLDPNSVGADILPFDNNITSNGGI